MTWYEIAIPVTVAVGVWVSGWLRTKWIVKKICEERGISKEQYRAEWDLYEAIYKFRRQIERLNKKMKQ